MLAVQSMQVRAIKREELERRTATAAFDREMCLAEARNAERLMQFYLSRCDDLTAAKELVEIFAALVEMGERRLTALGAHGETGV